MACSQLNALFPGYTDGTDLNKATNFIKGQFASRI